MVTRNISSYLQQIIDLDAGRHLWKYRLHNIVDRRPICFFIFSNAREITFLCRSVRGIVRIHRTETPICNRLHTVRWFMPADLSWVEATPVALTVSEMNALI